MKSCFDVLLNVYELEGVGSVAIPGDSAGPEHLLLCIVPFCTGLCTRPAQTSV